MNENLYESLTRNIRKKILILMILILFLQIGIILYENNIHYHILYIYYSISYTNAYTGSITNQRLSVEETSYIVGANGIFRFSNEVDKFNITKCIPTEIEIINNLPIKKKLSVLLHELIHYYQCITTYKKNKELVIKNNILEKSLVWLFSYNQKLIHPIFNNYQDFQKSKILLSNDKISKHVKKHYNSDIWGSELEAYTYNNILSFTYIELYVRYNNLMTTIHKQ